MKKALLLSLAIGIINIIPIGAQWLSNGTPVCIADSTQQDISAISDGYGGAIITWSDKRNGPFDIFAQRINASGIPLWDANGKPIAVSSNWKSAKLVSDGSDGGIIIWKENQRLYAQRVSGSGEILWSPGGVPIYTLSSQTAGFEIVSDGAGGAIICWSDNRNGNYDIFAQKINSQGIVQWTENGVVVCDTTGNQSYPEITADGLGGGVISWKDNRGGSSSYSDVYAQRISSAGQRQWPIYGLAVCTSPLDQWPISVIGNNPDGFIVFWKSNSDIAAQKIDSMGNIKWGSGTFIAYGDISGWDMSSNGMGGAFVAWEQFSNGYYNVKVQHIDSIGIKQWAPYGVLVATDSGGQFGPRIIPDQTGGAIVSWYNWGNNFDIKAQRINNIGFRAWSDTGLAICNAAESQQNISMVTNSQGGAIIAWEDSRNWNKDIYAQRVNYDGTIGVEGWPGILSRKNGFEIECFPNPFRGAATIKYYLPQAGMTKIGIYDAAGHLVGNLLNSFEESGYHSLRWNGRDDSGRRLSSGIYFIRAETFEGNKTTRLLLLK